MNVSWFNVVKRNLHTLKKLLLFFTAAGDDEDNACNVLINPEDTEQDVIKKIMNAAKPHL